MKRPILYVCLGLAAFIAAGWIGYNFYDPKSGSDRTSSSGSISVSATPDTPQGQPRVEDQTPSAETTGDATSAALRLLSWAADDDADVPTQCFTFNDSFAQADRVALSDYYSVSPNAPTTLSISGSTLCVSGFSFTESYRLTWKAGLQGSGEKVLASDISRDISFGDKPPFVGFAGQGVILPRVNAQGLGIETINVDELSVQILRVSDRMIARRPPVAGQANLEGDYSWQGNEAATDIRREIWSGTLPVKSVRNQKVTTVLPIGALIGTLEAGAYVVTATRKHDAGERDVANAWRWIISTDLALTSYRSDTALNVSVRSIETAKLQPQVTLQLLAANNEILSQRVTDTSGRVSFDGAIIQGKGPMRPKVIMAYGPSGDYAVLDLSRSPLDLSRYAIDGRNVSGALDVFAYTERGIYRPGEDVDLTALLRDAQGRAVMDRPVTLKIKRPNGIVMQTARIDADSLRKQAGGFTYEYILPISAARGMWSAVIEADGLGRVSTTSFSVQDFVPQKLRLSIKADAAPLGADDIRDVTLDAQFLYGAPGNALPAEAEARLRVDPNPFPDYVDYQFGPDNTDFREQLIDMGGGTTDGKGLLDLALDIKSQNLETSHPLRAEITAGAAEPGGRYTRNSLRIPLRTQSDYVGIASSTGEARFARGKPAVFNIVALSRLGERIQTQASYTLIEEDWDYQWFRQGSRWRYRRDVIDTVLKTGELDIGANMPATLSERLDWGSYRLVVKTDSGSESSYRFSIGWGSGQTSDAPDQIQMAGPSEPLKAGETITLDINAPYAGQAELVIANDRVRLIKTLRLPEGGSQIALPFDTDWGDSVYAMVTLYTPREVSDRPVPRRAVGVSYIERDRSAQKLALSIDGPDLIRPRQTQTITVDVENAPRGESIFMTVAAVDEGILLLTKYQSPDATKTLFGKKALGIEIYDDYARLLNPNLGAPALANSGGDSLGGEGLTVVPTRTVALFKGPVSVKNGQASVTFDVPDFNGELRIMATAWSASAVGSASRAVTVRDKVPAIVGLPRFLAPGDKALATVSLDNVEGAAGAYTAALSSSGIIDATDAVTFRLAQDQRLDDRIALSASAIGTTDMAFTVRGPNYSLKTSYPIQVRTPFFPVTRSEFITLAAGETLTLRTGILDGNFVPGSVDITASFSSVAGLNPAPYVNALARYPYGCTEQTVATALPLLYADQLGGFENNDRRGTSGHVSGIRKAVNRLVNRQDAQGAFGLWTEGDGDARAWLGVHTTFFLQEAAIQGYAVPQDALNRAYNAVGEISRMPRYPNVNYRFNTDRYDAADARREKAEAAAYAHFVLARAGKGRLPDMRYHFDQNGGAMKTPVSFAYLGAALSMMGDNTRAKKAFELGIAAKGFETSRDYYQSPLRDNAGYLSAAKTAKAEIFVSAMLPDFIAALDRADRLNTQEKAYVILAMQALLDGQTLPNVTSVGADLRTEGKSQVANFYDTDLASGITFTNRGDAPVYLSLSYSGAPKTPPQASANGFDISKRYFTMSGKPRDITTMKQGERAIVKIDFNSTQRRSRMAIIADLLPAGFEIETVLRPSDGIVENYGTIERGAYAFLGKLSGFDIAEARDDRFVASRETYRQDEYAAAYIVRAVTPGEFSVPGVVVEDMYRTQDNAITPASRMTITADNAL